MTRFSRAATPVKSASHLDGELTGLLEAILERYGYDFRDYALPSLRRRIRSTMVAEEASTLEAFRERLVNRPETMERFLLSMSINVTAMFRDPGFYTVFRQDVLPLLRTYPFIRIWHAGCSTGQEVYSMAIMLTEEGLYDRCRIYATDMNETVLRKAKAGIFSLNTMKKYTSNYIVAGGRGDFSEYYQADHNNAIFNSSLKRNIVFAQHNLVSDGSFNEFHAILCRNVVIYFNERLQQRVHRLFHQSLVTFGYLGLGKNEDLSLSDCRDSYEEIDGTQKLFRKTA